MANLSRFFSRQGLWGAIVAFTVIGIGALLSLGFTATTLSCVGVAWCGDRELTNESASLEEAVHFFDATDQRFVSANGARRITVPIESMPDYLVEGFVAVEDRRFWEHDGLDLKGMFRAFRQNLASGGVEEGASTIAMQLVRTLHSDELAETNRWRRKLIELKSAPRIVEELGRRGVLELYLNSIYLGEGTWGVGAASEQFFGVPADSIDVAQAATLIGMARTPERYNPRKHPDRAKQRRDDALAVMQREGVITAGEAAEARARPVETTEASGVAYGRGYVTSAVHEELERVAPELQGQPGLRVFTTLDPEMQATASTALKEHLAKVERGVYGSFRHEAAPEDLPRADTSPYLQGAAVALDVNTGAILAYVGGRDFFHSEVDRVARTKRQVGSLVKPFIYAEALRRGRNLYDEVSTERVEWRLDRSNVWRPDDHVGEGLLSLRDALRLSSNSAAVRLGREIGVDRVLGTAERMGVSGPLEHNPAALMGAFEASLLDMTRSYAPFANGGFVVEPYLIRRIEDRDGVVLYSRMGHGRTHRVLDATTSFLMVDALADVVDRGTGTAVRHAGFRGPAAGKTGTTNDGRDTWFVGITPRIAAGVWIGFDRPQPITGNAAGGTLAAPLWGSWMAAAPGTGGSWSLPVGVEKARYDTRAKSILPAHCEPTGPVVTVWVKVTTYRPMYCPQPETDLEMDRYDLDRIRYDSTYISPTIRYRPSPDDAARDDSTRSWRDDLRERLRRRNPDTGSARSEPDPRRPVRTDSAMPIPDIRPRLDTGRVRVRPDTTRPVPPPDTTPPPPPPADTVPPPPPDTVPPARPDTVGAAPATAPQAGSGTAPGGRGSPRRG